MDPFLPENKDDIKRLKDIQKELHNQFISFVSRRGSKITKKDKDLFTGAFWSGEKSLELGLIDDYGEMKSVLKQRFGENIKIKEFAPKKKLFGFSNLFSGALDIFINKIEERISFKKFDYKMMLSVGKIFWLIIILIAVWYLFKIIEKKINIDKNNKKRK